MQEAINPVNTITKDTEEKKCIPVVDSFWCLAKLIQCFRFKNKIKFKKKEKKNEQTEMNNKITEI